MGKPGTLIPRYARGTPAHASPSVRPPAPAISIGATKPWDSKPVARTSTSAGRSAPSAVRMPAGVTSAIALGHQLDVGLASSVGYQSSVSIIRLQPSSSAGVTLRAQLGVLDRLR